MYLKLLCDFDPINVCQLVCLVRNVQLDDCTVYKLRHCAKVMLMCFFLQFDSGGGVRDTIFGTLKDYHNLFQRYSARS